MTDAEGATGCVHVIDDDPEIRGSLQSLLRSAGFSVVLHESPASFLDSGTPAEAACLVLDVRLRQESGLDFQQRLIDEAIAIPVILITGHGDIPMTVRAMRMGAVDFLPKPFSDEQMLDAVSTALARDRARRLSSESDAHVRRLYERLTSREREVMGLVTAGLMNKQVAAHMGLSEITVKIHRGNMMRKLEAQSLADLVRMAEQLGVRKQGVRRFNISV